MTRNADPQPLAGLAREVCESDQHDDLVRTKGRHEQKTLLAGVAHASDEDIAEACCYRVGDVGGEDPEGVQPGVGVSYGLPELVPFEYAVADALLVLAHAFRVQCLLLGGQELGREG